MGYTKNVHQINSSSNNIKIHHKTMYYEQKISLHSTGHDGNGSSDE